MRYRRKDQEVEACPDKDGVWAVSLPGGPTTGMGDTSFHDHYEPVPEGEGNHVIESNTFGGTNTLRTHRTTVASGEGLLLWGEDYRETPMETIRRLKVEKGVGDVFERQYAELAETFKAGIILRPELLTLIDVQEKERGAGSLPPAAPDKDTHTLESPMETMARLEAEKEVPLANALADLAAADKDDPPSPDPRELAKDVTSAIKLLNGAVAAAEAAGLVVDCTGSSRSVCYPPLTVQVYKKLIQ